MKLTKIEKPILIFFLIGIPVGLAGTFILEAQNWETAVPVTDVPLASSLSVIYLIFAACYSTRSAWFLLLLRKKGK